MLSESESALKVPPRTIPIPTSISAEAQAYLASPVLMLAGELAEHLRGLAAEGQDRHPDKPRRIRSVVSPG